jgi:bacteriorhodopsin
MILPRTNDALKINPPPGQHHLSTSGSDWMWTICAIYCLGLISVIGLSYFARAGEKIFHYLFIFSFFVGSVAYFTTASDLGSVAVVQTMGDDKTRQIFYAKYINWFLSWPPLLVAIGLISGVSWSTIVYNILLCWIFVVCNLIGALIPSTYKWGFFVFGTVASFLLVASLLSNGLVTSKRLGIHRHYLLLAGWLSFLYMLYPIAWGLNDGGNEISVTSGVIFVGILDCLTVPVIAALMLFWSRTWDYKSLNIYFTQYGRVAVQGGEFPEKVAPTPAGAPLREETPVDAV